MFAPVSTPAFAIPMDRPAISSGPEPGAVAPETEDPLAYAQDLQRERCVLFVACTRARDHLHVSGTGEPSPFLPPGAVEPVPPPAALHSR